MALAACTLLIGVSMMQSCKDDDTILTGQPDWLGNSIYERLQDEGNYTYMLRLIDDGGQREVLSRTGSKTLFVADDAAFNEWFKGNDWGVTRYEDLSSAQKTLLLNNSMIDNAYLIELLSNLPVSGSRPLAGMCMRRNTAVSVYDSITVLKAADMPTASPNTESWDYVRNRPGGIYIVRDNTAAPMIHFLPAFMRTNKISGSDLEILTNGVSTSIEDAWVNGKRVEESDITCKNGYIQKVGGVIESAQNMADIIRNHKNMSRWSQLLDRFCAPYYIGSYTSLNIDSLFELRYFADISARGKNQYTPGDQTVEPKPVSATLKFDPGWNGYYNYGSSSINSIGPDAAVMIVPSDEAMNHWWQHDGRVLQEKYGSWDSIPQLVLSKLLNVNMLTSFVESVPSKFESVLDDAKMEMGIKPEHIDSCFMGCNGVVYLTNRVFAPREYSSVSFPALIHQDLMSVIYWAMSDEKLSFGPYLNSMDTYYSLFLPSDSAMVNYIDPVSYGETRQILWQFYYDNTATTKQRVKARRYYVTRDPETGEYSMDGYIGLAQSSESGSASNDMVRNRLDDMLNTLIVVGNVEDGHQYYRTKGGSMVRVKNAGVENVMSVEGGLQQENGTPLTVRTIYDQSTTGNGKSYLIDGAIVQGASKSVYQTLSEHAEMQTFLDLLSGNDEDSTKYNLLINTSGNYHCTNYQSNYNVRLFEKYNYTVYVPTNESIQELIDRKFLPTWDDYDAQTEDLWDGNEEKARQARAIIRNRIFNFVRYHLQDNSVYIGGEPVSGIQYETSKLNMETQRFYSLMIDADDTQMTIGYGPSESAKRVQKRNVLTDSGLYNLTCREYWLSGSGTGRMINSASDAVVHLIDGVLLYDDSLTSQTWEDELEQLRRSN